MGCTVSRKEKGLILVIGCGIVDLKALQSGQKEIIGIDIAKEALEKSKKLGEVILGDGTQLPFPDSSFDSICGFDVLEHVPNKAEMIIEVHRTLKKYGKIFFSVPIRIKDEKGDKRQPFDEPPTLSFLIHLITSFVYPLYGASEAEIPSTRFPIPFSLFYLHFLGVLRILFWVQSTYR